MRLIFLVSLAFWGLASSLRAEDKVTIGDLVHKQISQRMIETVGTAGETLSWANVRLQNEGKPQFYCQPTKLLISDEQYLSILKDYVDAYPRFEKEDWVVFPYLLIDALAEKFPCPR